ncbi:imidazole glycerol phosphate synthase subunit HisF [Candidatus Gracilibacteria bacterium]|nr:imidazole glycerol phosphate synthase subunit HisF [Candidatus Gracilibacteria bacterium]
MLGKALYENKISLSEAFNVTRPRSNLAKRIIPCLDVAQGRVVKGVNFLNIKDAGDPVELAKKYSEEGADELVFLDIMASKENRETMIDTVRRVAAHISIPFTVGGGVKTLEDIRALLNAGADKVSLNTAAIIQPELITEASKEFGAQCVVIAIDVKKDRDSKDDRYDVYIKGGSKKTELEAVSWAKRVEELGAGELLLTSMDRDGTHTGFDIELLQKITSAVRIPVIASGGAGSLEDLAQALTKGNADAVLAASLFHYHETTTAAAKQYLASLNIPVRIGKQLNLFPPLFKMIQQKKSGCSAIGTPHL